MTMIALLFRWFPHFLFVCLCLSLLFMHHPQVLFLPLILYSVTQQSLADAVTFREYVVQPTLRLSLFFSDTLGSPFSFMKVSRFQTQKESWYVLSLSLCTFYYSTSTEIVPDLSHPVFCCEWKEKSRSSSRTTEPSVYFGVVSLS